MYALIALALTLPPSLAAGAWAWVWLQRERDKKLNDQHARTIADTNDIMLKQDGVLAQLQQRVQDCEKNIGILTDRSMR